jgi:hypothetical protein
MKLRPSSFLEVLCAMLDKDKFKEGRIVIRFCLRQTWLLSAENKINQNMPEKRNDLLCFRS